MKPDLYDGLVAAGALLIGAGVAMISIPAALCVTGALLIGAGLAGARATARSDYARNREARNRDTRYRDTRYPLGQERES